MGELTGQSYPELDDEALAHFRDLCTHRETGAVVILYPRDCATCARIAAWASALGTAREAQEPRHG